MNIFGNGTLALLTIVLAEVWRGLGFWTLYFLASLQNIPEELLDAARVDGAKGFQRFRRVTIPLLRPMLLFAVVIAIIANFQVFDTVYVLTQGGPYQSTSTIVWFIWKRLFQFQQTGQGYAAAVLLLGIILVLTAISFWLLGARRREQEDADGGRTARHVEARRDELAARRTTRRRRAATGSFGLGKGFAAYVVLIALRADRDRAVPLPALAVASGRATSSSRYPPQWIPNTLYSGNFGTVLHDTSYLRWALNTLIFATSRHADHARDRHARRLRVRAAAASRAAASLFALVISTLMIPTAAIVAPLYIMISHLPGWTHAGVNTYPGMILPMVCSPLGRLHDAPVHLDAARGRSSRRRGSTARREFQIFRKIVLPLMKPAIVVLGIFTFMFQWVNFLWPLVITTTDNMKTLTVGIASLQGQFVTNWGVISAAAVMTMVPVIIVFLIFQRWFVQASMAGALKQ